MQIKTAFTKVITIDMEKSMLNTHVSLNSRELCYACLAGELHNNIHSRQCNSSYCWVPVHKWSTRCILLIINYILQTFYIHFVFANNWFSVFTGINSRTFIGHIRDDQSWSISIRSCCPWKYQICVRYSTEHKSIG